jgi:adenylate cyclase class IV
MIQKYIFKMISSRRRLYSTSRKPLEIEMKFKLNAETKQRIQNLPNIKFISSQVFEDVYYDSEHYQITTKDVWLRKRIKKDVAKWEMKVPINFKSIKSQDSVSRVS